MPITVTISPELVPAVPFLRSRIGNAVHFVMTLTDGGETATRYVAAVSLDTDGMSVDGRIESIRWDFASGSWELVSETETDEWLYKVEFARDGLTQYLAETYAAEAIQTWFAGILTDAAV